MALSLDAIIDSKTPGDHAIKTVFGLRLSKERSGGFQPYIDYCNDELRLLRRGVSQLSWQSQKLAVKTCEDLSHICAALQNNQEVIRPEIRRMLFHQFPRASSVELNLSIDLSLRLWLMLNFQENDLETLKHLAKCIQWDESTSLKERIESLFPYARWEVNPSNSRLGPHFTAVFMSRACGLRIEWTTSILDHLRLNRGKGVLQVYPYKYHLNWLLSGSQNQVVSPIPPTVLKETILSLNLLFPIWDGRTIPLLKREKQYFHETGPYLTETKTLTLADFDYWRDRLIELREVLDAPPVSWRQRWRDRRNPQQFWTFWIALFILLISVLSLAASVVQAWASVRALNFAYSQIG